MAVTRAVRVLTVDGQAVFRHVAGEVIAAPEAWRPSGKPAVEMRRLEAVQRLASDLVLLDVRMPGLDGIEVGRRLVASGSDVVILLVSIDPPSAAQLGRAAPLVRKEDLGPRLLRRLWTENRA